MAGRMPVAGKAKVWHRTRRCPLVEVYSNAACKEELGTKRFEALQSYGARCIGFNRWKVPRHYASEVWLIPRHEVEQSHKINNTQKM